MNQITSIYILFGCLHFASIFLLSSFISQLPQFAFLQRTWGYHFFIYFPVPVIVIAYGLYLGSLIRALQYRIASTLNFLHEITVSKRNTLAFLVIGIIATIAMWAVSQKYPFLGDGHVRAAELNQGIIHTSGTPYIKMLVVLSSTFQWDGRLTYQVASTLLTLPFILVGLGVACEIGSNTLSRAASAILIIFSGVIQFYAGYIEIYAPLPILILLTVWLGLLSERIPTLRYGSLLIAVIAFLLHPLCGILLPPTLYLVWYHDLKRQKFSFKMLFLATFAVGVGLAFYQGRLDRILEATLPMIREANRSYAFLTATNFWERLNGIILCSPAALPLLSLLAINKGEIIPSSRAGFLWLLTGSGGVSVFAFDFVLGSQDWDVMALVAFPVSLSCAHYLSSVSQDKMAAIAIPAIVICILNTGSWTLVNRTDASIVRLEDTIIDEPATYFRTHNRSIRIALALMAEDKRAESIEVLKRESIRVPENAQVLHNLATFQHQSAQYDDAIVTARTLLKLTPWNTYAYRILQDSHRSLDQPREAENLSKDYAENLITQAEMAKDDGNDREAALFWCASAFTDLEDPSILATSPDALNILTNAYLSNPEQERLMPLYKLPQQMKILARRTYRLGKPEEAILLWQAALRMGVQDAIVDIANRTPEAHPMSVLRTAISLLSHGCPSCEDNSPEAELEKSKYLLARIPTCIGVHQMALDGKDPVEPDQSLSHAAKTPHFASH